MTLAEFERSLAKALLRGVLALPLGIILGFIFEFIANIIYNLGLGICAQMGVVSYRNPAAWIARGLAWAVFGDGKATNESRRLVGVFEPCAF